MNISTTTSIYKKFVTRLTLVIIGFFLISVLASLCMTFSKSSITPYAVEHFVDYSKDDLYVLNVGHNIAQELNVSPHTQPLLRYVAILAFTCIFITFIWSLVLVVKHWRTYGFFKVCIFISIVFLQLVIWFFALIYSSDIVQTVLIKIAKNNINSVLQSSDKSNAVSSIEDIRKAIQQSSEPVNLVVGYGYSGVALPLLSKPNNKTNFDTMVLPSALYLYSKAAQNGTSVWSQAPVWYFPDTHTIVITDVKKVTDLQHLVTDLIGNRGLGIYSEHVKSVPALQNYGIVPDTEYTNYYIQKVKDSNQKDITLLNKDLQNNLTVISECNSTIKSNRDTLFQDEEDYKNNCKVKVNYSNCDEFLNSINSFKVSMNENEASCQKEVSLAQKYNSEIKESITQLEKSNTQYENPESLDRKQAELSSGVFIGPSSIYIRDVADQYELFRTATHEYIHYSVNSDTRDLPAFLDEGLTDYFVEKTFGYNDYYTVGDAGYFAEVQIILALLERIPSKDIYAVYVSGNEAEFKQLFTKYFENISYEEFASKGEDIFKTSYQFEGRQFSYDPFSSRDYIGMQVIDDMRNFLGLETDYNFNRQ